MVPWKDSIDDQGYGRTTTLTASGVKRLDGAVGDSLNGLTGALKQVVWIFAVDFSVLLRAHAQQTEELQKQIQQLRRQYQQTTLELQQRIAALEHQLTLEYQLTKENEPEQNPLRKEGGRLGRYRPCY